MNPEETLQNKDPAFVIDFFHIITEFFAEYGWFVLLGLVVSYFAARRIFNSNVLRRYQQRKAEDEYTARYHKNPDLFQARQNAMEEARRKMQEKLDKDAEEFVVKQKQREEKKRTDWLERHSSTSSGTKLGRGSQPDVNKKTAFKKEYNPLSGDSGSSYRAPKRSCCGGGGGCG